jgi:FkbM family methyltransferase
MKQYLKKIASELYSRAVLANNPYYNFGIPKADYSIQGGSVNLRKLGIVVDKHQKEIIKGYPFATKIKEALGGNFRVEGGNVYLELDSLCIRINSAEELFIIYEVFVCGVYSYVSLRDAAVIDVGMNSGITTLFHAKNPRIKKIFSFELFNPTFILGERNLKLNQQYSEKVKAFNYGLSDRDFETDLEYSLSRKGRMGLGGLPTDEIFSDTKKEHVIVRDIKKVFDELIEQCQGLDIVVKMDCEGEEYKLIKRLSNTGMLGTLTALIIEWHNSALPDIEDLLRLADFHVFSQRYPNLDTGMIYAVRK